MSTQESNDLSAAESNLGKVLAVIQRVLPRLDEPARTAEVQEALRKAAAFLETARQAHAGGASGPVPAEVVAAIAAAISTVLPGPYKLVSIQSMQKVAVPAPHLNAWAVQGRHKIFDSHKTR